MVHRPDKSGLLALLQTMRAGQARGVAIDLSPRTAPRRRPVVVGVRRERASFDSSIARRVAVVAYVEDGAGEAALRIAAEGAAMRGASLVVLDPTSTARATDALVEASRSAELIVIGARPVVPTDTVRLDSIARSLSHHADCPVMFVPPSANALDVGDVVCGVNRSTGSAAALQWAAREAALRGGTVLAQEVVTLADADRQPTQSLTGWVFAQEIAEPTTIVCRRASGASVARELAHSALERGAMLVVGSHRRDGGHLHRCVTGRLAGHTSVPMIVVPPEIPAPRTPPGT